MSAGDCRRIHTVLSTRGAGASLGQLRVIVRSVIAYTEDQGQAFDRLFEEFFPAHDGNLVCDIPAALIDFELLLRLPSTNDEVTSQVATCLRPQRPSFASPIEGKFDVAPVQPAAEPSDPELDADLSIHEMDDQELGDWIIDVPPCDFDPNACPYFTMGMVRRDAGAMLSQEQLQEAADSLGFFLADSFSAELDIDGSINTTLSHGGLPSPEFARKRHLLTVVLLIDDDAEANRWNSVPHELVAGLTRRGVASTLYRFHGTPEVLIDSYGRVSHIDDLEDKRGELIVMIVSDGHGMCRQIQRRVLERFSRWPRVALFDPRPAEFWDLLPEIAGRLKIGLYPCSGRGVIQCLKRFASETGHISNDVRRPINAGHWWRVLPTDHSPESYLRTLVRPAVLNWARACALVPSSISIGLADHLRRTLFAEVEPTEIATLVALPDTTLSAGGIRFSDRVRDTLLLGFQTLSPSFQSEVANCLCKEIDSSTTNDYLAHRPSLAALQAKFIAIIVRSLVDGQDVDPLEFIRIWKVKELKVMIISVICAVFDRIRNEPLRRVVLATLRRRKPTDDVSIGVATELNIREPLGTYSSIEECSIEPPHLAWKNEDKFPTQNGRYRLVSRLGRGGFGVVYHAYDEQLCRNVAMKVPHLGYRSIREWSQILDEARMLATLSHPAVVTIYDIGESDDNTMYIVSELLDGVPLNTIIGEGKLTILRTCEILATVAEALQYVHSKSVIHRDIKPSNILIDHDGKPHLIDFGLAIRSEDELTRGVTGTPAYMSPEQAKGQSLIDGRSDIYSFGVVMYEMLTGQRPFGRRESILELLMAVMNESPVPLRNLSRDIPPRLESICEKCMAKNVNARYSTAIDLAHDLNEFLRQSSESLPRQWFRRLMGKK